MKNLKPRRTNDSYNAMYVLEHPAKMFLKGFSNGLHNCPFKVFWNLFFLHITRIRPAIDSEHQVPFTD